MLYQRTLLAFCWIVFQFLPQHIWAQMYNFALVGGKQSVEIPFEQVDGYVIVTLQIHGILPARFILDTGSRYTMLTKQTRAKALGLEYGEKRYQVMGSDRVTLLHTFIARGVFYTIDGQLIASEQSVMVLEEDCFKLDEMLGTPIDGLLGSEIFHNYVVDIDYRTKTIRLSDKPRPKMLKYTKLNLQIIDGKPYAYVRAMGLSGAGSSDSLFMLLDSGAGLQSLFHIHPRDTVGKSNWKPGIIGQGLGGIMHGYRGMLAQLGLDTLTLNQLSVSFHLPQRIDTLRSLKAQGIVGNEVLSRFELCFDFRGKALYLRPYKGYRKAYRKDVSGMTLRAMGPDLRTFVVKNVWKGSASDFAGLQEGDELLSVNGKKLKNKTLFQVERYFSKPEGSVLQLKIKRNQQLLNLTMRLGAYL